MQFVTLTPMLIAACKTENGGYTSATIRALGMTLDEFTKGWPARLVGKRITEDQYAAALASRVKRKVAARIERESRQPQLPLF